MPETVVEVTTIKNSYSSKQFHISYFNLLKSMKKNMKMLCVACDYVELMAHFYVFPNDFGINLIIYCT